MEATCRGLDAMFGDALVGIAALDVDGQAVWRNRALAALMGGPTPSLAESADERARYQQLLGGQRGSYRLVRIVRRPDGAVVQLRLNVSALSWPDDPRISALMVVEHLTEASAAGEAPALLHELGERVKELTALHVISRFLDDRQRSTADLLQDVAAAVARSTQYPDDTWCRVRHGDVTRVASEAVTPASTLRQSFATEDGLVGEIELGYRHDHPTEHEGPFLAEERALLESVADLLRVALDHRACDGELRRSGERLDLALTSAEMGVWELNIDTNRTTWSTHFARLAGREGAIEGPAGIGLGLLHPDDRQRVHEQLSAAAANGDAFEIEFRLQRGDGQYRWMLGRGRAYAEPTRLLGVVTDVSRRKAMEEQLRQSQKMEALGLVAAGVAHDFNNLLMVIGGGAALSLDADDAALRRELAAEIKSAAERGVGLTQQLLAFSRRSETSPVMADVNGLVRGLEPLLCRLAGREIAVRLALAAQGRIRIDPTGLEQVVMNLVVNARDATAAGGTIEIGTRDVTFEDRPHVALEVRDTGIGMDAETRARIFEPFFTTKEPGKGTGLGLAIVVGVAEQHGGRIEVDSELGRGSTFRVLFPAAP